MLTSIENCEESINEDTISDFEKRFSIILPDDYKSFLVKHNGGNPTPRRFTTIDNKLESSFILLLPLANITTENLISNYIIFNQGNKICKNLMP